MNRPLLTLSMLASLLVPGAIEALQRTSTADEAVQLGLDNNPDLKMLAADIEAAAAKLVGASLLFQENPSLTATGGPRSSPARRTRDESLQLVQPIEIGGQRGLRIEAAQAALDVAEARLGARRSEVAAAIRETFARALAAELRVRLASEAVTVAQEGVAAAQERFEAGAAALLEVNTARVELGRMARDRGEAERRGVEARADLHLLLGVDPGEPLLLRGELDSGKRDFPEESHLLDEALANRAEIVASRRAVDAGNAAERLATRAAIPTPRIGASYTREEESATSIVQALVSIDLPLFHRNQEARGIAAARVTQLETERDATERRVRQEVSTALARWRAARAAADGYASDVIQAMEENMELGTESYRAGKIDFLQLLLIRRQALEARHEHIDVLEELSAAGAQLDRAVGSAE